YTAGVGWSPPEDLAPMPTARTLATAALLSDGDVLFVGGYNDTDKALASAERYRPSTNTWTTAGPLERPRYDSVAVSLLDGRVLVVGGRTLTRQYSDAELFDPMTSTFGRYRGGSDERAVGHTATLLADGRILAVAGWDEGPGRFVGSVDLFDL